MNWDNRLRVHINADHGRINVRDGGKGRCRDVCRNDGTTIDLDTQSQQAHITGGSTNPFSHLLLNGQDNATRAGHFFKQMPKNGRRNVVRHIGDHQIIVLIHQRGWGKAQNIALNNAHIWVRSEHTL